MVQWWRTTFVVIASLGLLFVPPAWSHTQTLIDRDDTPSPLDTVAVRHWHRVSGDRNEASLVFKLVTYETWDSSVLGHSFENFISFEFDENLDGRPERCFDIQLKGESLKGRMYTGFGCVAHASAVGSAIPVARPDEHSVKVNIPKHLVGRKVSRYRWRSATSFEQQDHPECASPEQLPPERRYATCVDRTGWKTQRL